MRRRTPPSTKGPRGSTPQGFITRAPGRVVVPRTYSRKLLHNLADHGHHASSCSTFDARSWSAWRPSPASRSPLTLPSFPSVRSSSGTGARKPLASPVTLALQGVRKGRTGTSGEPSQTRVGPDQRGDTPSERYTPPAPVHRSEPAGDPLRSRGRRPRPFQVHRPTSQEDSTGPPPQPTIPAETSLG